MRGYGAGLLGAALVFGVAIGAPGEDNGEAWAKEVSGATAVGCPGVDLAPDPLFLAASRGDGARALALLDERAGEGLEDALAAALLNGHFSLAGKLWERGADLSSVLWSASPVFESSHPEQRIRVRAAVAWVLERGADADTRDFGGRTLLMRASAAGNVELVALLVEHGDVNAADDRGRTALMRAGQAGHPEVVRVLLDRGAERGARATDGATAMELARTEEVRRLLR